jgi:pyruvate kinase
MTEAPEPTRAEVSDVATAVLVGADCVMLSDETANGKYPIEAVKIMKRVIKYSEANAPLKAIFPANELQDTQAAIPKAVVHLAETVKAKAIVAETKSGATALQLAALRSEIPLIVVTDEVRTAQQLAVVYGAKSYVRPAHKEAAMKLTDWLLKEKVLKKGDMVVTASGRSPGVVGTTDTIKVRMLE